MKTWFKFYGQEFLTDPKMLSLKAVERALWLTMLCLASASDEEGVIKHIDEYKIMTLTGIDPRSDEWHETQGFLKKFEDLDMITNDNKMITLKSFTKRQQQNMSSYERVKKHREKAKSEAKNDNKVKRYHDNARIEKNREEKNISTTNVVEALPANGFGDKDINEGIELMKKDTGSVVKEKLNRYSLSRLYKSRGKDRTFKAWAFAQRHKDKQYCPSINSFLDLEEKWASLENFANRSVAQKNDNNKHAFYQEVKA